MRQRASDGDRVRVALAALPSLAAMLALAGCGGGGASASSLSVPHPMTSAGGATGTTALAGVVTDDASPAPIPIAGASVTLYPAGVALTGTPAIASATTAADGSWSMNVAARLTAGAYVLVVAAADAAHADLHQGVAVFASTNPRWSETLTVLSPTEQRCIADFNQQRLVLGVPALSSDTTATLAARAEAKALAAWDGQGGPGGVTGAPNVAPSTYAADGGLGSTVGPNDDLGASGCPMAIGNLFAGGGLAANGSVSAAWLGFGVFADPILNSDYVAVTVQYP